MTQGDRLAAWAAGVHDEFGIAGRVAGFEEALDDLLGANVGAFAGTGPRLRPLLVLLAGLVAEGESRRTSVVGDPSEHAALTVELVHLAVAVHDATLGHGRRKRLAKKLLGTAASWVGTSDFALRALELARHAPAPEVMGDVVDTLGELNAGRNLRAISFTAPGAVDYAEQRTGAVYRFACRSGSMVEGASGPLVERLGRYGRHTGLAAHLGEDLDALSLSVDEASRVLHDWAHLQRPVLWVAEAGSEDPVVFQLWGLLAQTQSRSATERLLERVHRTTAPSRVRQRIALAAWTARKTLAQCPETPARASLDALAQALVPRGGTGMAVDGRQREV